MNYIVNPAIFYWISVLDDIRGVCIVFMILSVVGIIVLIGCYASDGWAWDDNDREMFKKCRRIVIPIFAFSLLGMVFIPDKKTMTEMLVAKFATVENANWTLENVKNAVDYIVEAMKTLK